MDRIDIVIPVYNEGESILNVYEHLQEALRDRLDWRALFVYDFDEDSTIPTLRELQRADNRVVLLRQDLGKGVINALRYAFRLVHDGAVAVVMGDDSDELETLPRMYQAHREGAAIVASSRYSRGGQYHGGKWLKKTLSRLAGLMLSMLGIGTRDPTNNFKLYSGEFLKSVDIESQGGFEIALELTVKARVLGHKVAEVPGTWRDRTDGESKFRLFKWLPHYLRWFLYYIQKRIST